MKEFLKQLFSDAPGVSFGRAATAVCLVAGIVWVTRVVWITNALPALDGVTFWALSFYVGGKALGKGAEVLSAFALKQSAVSSQQTAEKGQ